jgi:catechol 2,3-dioxygenase-like lactoylglutathione lyase family enzyme
MASLLKNLGYVSYDVTDWQRAKKFYSETLGLPVAAFISDETGWMEFGKGETHFAIRQWRGPGPLPPRGGGGIAVYNVDDAYATIKELRRQGVRCDDVVAIPEMVTYADFYDPDGNKLQIVGPAPAKG